MSAIAKSRRAEVIDFRANRFERMVGNVDAVLDLVGGETQARSFAVLKPGGVLVSTVSPPNPSNAARPDCRGEFFLVEVTTARLGQIAAMLERKELVVELAHILPLRDVRTAHEMSDGLRVRSRGKIVLVPGS